MNLDAFKVLDYLKSWVFIPFIEALQFLFTNCLAKQKLTLFVIREFMSHILFTKLNLPSLFFVNTTWVFFFCDTHFPLIFVFPGFTFHPFFFKVSFYLWNLAFNQIIVSLINTRLSSHKTSSTNPSPCQPFLLPRQS